MATFTETMLAKYEALLQTSAGLDTVSVDGHPTGWGGGEKLTLWAEKSSPSI
jgi:hypothetical protein